MNGASLECTLMCEHRLRMSVLLYAQWAQLNGFLCDLACAAKSPGCLKLQSQFAEAHL